MIMVKKFEQLLPQINYFIKKLLINIVFAELQNEFEIQFNIDLLIFYNPWISTVWDKIQCRAKVFHNLHIFK